MSGRIREKAFDMDVSRPIKRGAPRSLTHAPRRCKAITHPCPNAPCSLSIAQQLAGSRPAMYGVRSSATLRPSPLELLGRPSSPSAGTADVLRRTVPSQRPSHYELSWSQQATRLDPCPPSLLCTLHAPTQPPTMTHLCWTPRSGQGCVGVRADERAPAPQDVVSVGISLERSVRTIPQEGGRRRLSRS